VRNPDGTEFDAHAKFVVDTAGAGIIESSPWGAVAEILTSAVARAIDAPAADYRIVLLAEGVDIKLRNDRRPAPGFAIAARTIAGAVDAIDGTVQHVDPKELARIAMLHALTQVGDHGGASNHVTAGDPARLYSVDHATAFPAEHSGGTGPATLNLSGLLAPILSANPEVLREAATGVTLALTNEVVADIIASVPRQLLPTDESRERLATALRQRRDALPTVVEQQYPKTKP
jgi:hypothetical protein